MKILKLILGITFVIFFSTCEKPDALKEEAFLEIENTSSSYDITGVYYSNSSYGSNRISSNIEPGESKTFTLDAEDDYIYNIRVTSNDPDAPEYSNDDIHFYDNRRITVRLTNDGWDDYYPW
jgi:hypothetical protein